MVLTSSCVAPPSADSVHPFLPQNLFTSSHHEDIFSAAFIRYPVSFFQALSLWLGMPVLQSRFLHLPFDFINNLGVNERPDYFTFWRLVCDVYFYIFIFLYIAFTLNLCPISQACVIPIVEARLFTESWEQEVTARYATVFYLQDESGITGPQTRLIRCITVVLNARLHD